MALPGQPALLTDDLIPFTNSPSKTNLIGIADENTGKWRKTTIAILLGLVGNTNTSGSGITEASDIATMLAGADANNDSGLWIFVLDASGDPIAISGWGLYRYQGGGRATLANYILIASQRNKADRGDWDLGAGEYPMTSTSAKGSGLNGDIQRGDYWVVTVGGMLDRGNTETADPTEAEYIPSRSTIMALIDNPTSPIHFKITT